ncbi:MAG: DNA primase [Thermomicrobiales bacterium]|nr:DNA primase [Thermomicrobiales bacterium]
MQRDAVSEIRERLDIIELINGYTPLKKAGRSFKGLCPFHQEKTPSFVVFPDSQNFHCFGCGKGGDLFTFYMEIERVDFREALRELARRAGVELEHTLGIKPEQDERRERLLAAVDLAATFYHDILLNHPAGEPGRRLAADRGLDAKTIERFRLGFAPESWEATLNLLASKGFDQGIAIEAGLAGERDSGGAYDRFRNRFMFPIANRDGKYVGFGARAIGDDQPKYLNSPQTPLFDKSSLLYALDLAKDAIRADDRAIVVEGYMDAIAAHQFGHTNVIAAMGTALTEAQVTQLKRFSKRIVLALDADAAGQMATLRSLETMPDALDQVETPAPDAQGFVRFQRKLDAKISILRLPEGKDPDELIRKHPELWDDLIEEATPFLDFFIDTVAEQVDLDDPNSKSAAFQRIAPLLRLTGDQVTQQHYISRISGKLRISEQVLWSELRRGQFRPLPGAVAVTSGRKPARRIRNEDYLTAVLLKHVSLAPELLEAVTEDDLLDSRNREIIRTLRMSGADTLDADTLITWLDPEVADHADSILQLLNETPAGYSSQVRAAGVAALNGIRRERLDFLLRQLQSELHAAHQDADVETIQTLTSQLTQLADQKKHFVPPKSPYFKDLRDNTGF